MRFSGHETFICKQFWLKKGYDFLIAGYKFGDDNAVVELGVGKNMVAAGVCDEILVQVAYAIGVVKPVGLYVNTYGTAHVKLHDGEIAKKVEEIFDMRPYAIVKRFQLKNPIFTETASYGHFGRDFYEKEVEVFYTDKNTYKKMVNGVERIFKTVPFFGWERLDMIDEIKCMFSL